MYNWVHTTRIAVLCVVSVFSLIVLGLGAHWISVTEQKLDNFYSYAALAVATAVLTFTVPVMLVIDVLRRGAITSMILVELCWLGFLWVMWLATAADSANQLPGFGSSCHLIFEASWFSEGCQETQAIVAFSFLNWIALTGYLFTLLWLCIVAANRGAGVWTSTVKEAQFSPVKVDFSGAMGTPEGKVGDISMQQPELGQTYPPQPAGTIQVV